MPRRISEYDLTSYVGIMNSHLTELIEMDHNYLTRINLRKQIIHDHHDIVIQASPAVKPSVDELYVWLVNAYLPTRFPSMFTTSSDGLQNLTTGKYLPLQPPVDPSHAFEILGENLDEDFLILLPSADGDGYALKGFVTCFPAGFNTKEKFGQKLREIHKPVPGYKQKLEKSMDRFFEKIEVGKVVKRSNVCGCQFLMVLKRLELIVCQWSITTHGRLYAASENNHLYEGETVVQEEIDINNVSPPVSFDPNYDSKSRHSSGVNGSPFTDSQKPELLFSTSRPTCILSRTLRRKD